MKIKIEYDIDATSRYDYEPSFRTVKKEFEVDEFDVEEYLLEKIEDLEEEELEKMIDNFDYYDERFLEWLERKNEYEN